MTRRPSPSVPVPGLTRSTSPACSLDSECTTCSDEGILMRVIRVYADGLAECVGEDGAIVDVMTGVVELVAPGDVLLVHAGTALIRLDPHEGTR